MRIIADRREPVSMLGRSIVEGPAVWSTTCGYKPLSAFLLKLAIYLILLMYGKDMLRNELDRNKS
jgi:hypothetical protein